jgi:type II secretory pathway component GspD/PulD (secretin)
LNHIPASDTAASLQQFVGDEIKIVPLTLSNSLLIGGVQGDRAEFLRDLVALLDRKPAAVDIDVTIIQADANGEAETKDLKLSGDAKDVASQIEALQKAGTLKVLERLHLTGTENQIAQVQVGREAAMARGVNFSPRGQVPTYVVEQMGSILTATSRVSGEDLLIEISVEKSWVPDKAEPASDDSDGATFRPDEKKTVQIRSTIRVPKGQAVHIGGMTVNAEGKQSRISAVVTAKIVP